ncbi:MAG: VWA domain-containing protein [Longimicrobiales bacterium]|nr:VWA domain-containing protein [Longimicrobiales bacterium]
MRRAGAVVVAVLSMAFTPASGAAQGWIEPGPRVGGFDVEKTRSEVRVRLDGRVAQVEVTEWFKNCGGRVAEGHYLYPLPGEAVFQGFSLFQGDAELRGEIMDAAQARSIYEEIVRRRADPALIELAGHGLLRARVFPIEPGQERKVTLRYTQVLARAGNALQLQYAGGVRGADAPAPMRAAPGGEAVRGDPEAVRTLFEVVAEAGDAYMEPFSPTHTLEVERDGARLTVRVEGELSGRLAIFFPLAGDVVGLALAAHRPVGDDGYFMLTLSPGRNPGAGEPRDVTVVMDVSGSMSGEKIEQARSALRGLLGTLSARDRFRLVAFSSDVRPEAEGWTAAQRAGLERARAWVDALVADGGTNIAGALDEAFRLESPAARLPVVIFLTDGLPSVGEQSPERLADRAQARAGRARVFAFGVGHDVNTHLLDRLGEAGRGSTEYVEPGEDVERAIGLLAAKVRHPVLTDLELGGAPVRLTEIYPVRIPDVFAGEELVLFGRYQGQGTGPVSVRGHRAGVVETFSAAAAFPRASDANAYIPRLWASRKLGHLTRQIWTEGETAGLVEEIRTLALRYGLPSPYTSYLVTEPEVVAGGGGRPVPMDLAKAQAVGGIARSGGTAQGAFIPAAPAASSGEAAVRLANDARRMREASSMEALDEADEELASRLERLDGNTARAVAGRIFRLEGGVWRDAAHPDGREPLKVKAYSAAYFRLLEALPELRPALKELGTALVAGGRVSIQVGDEGVETLTEAMMSDIVIRFRGAPAAP